MVRFKVTRFRVIPTETGVRTPILEQSIVKSEVKPKMVKKKKKRS